MSNVPYISKTIERVVAARLSVDMSEYNVCEPIHSAYKPNHCVETLVCVQNDILRAMDNQTIVNMLLLDLSTAFDTVNNNVMLHRLSHHVGVVQTALDWFKSYLSDLFQSVHINGCTSRACSLTCGVPQGSVLGPQLFFTYAASLSKVIRELTGYAPDYFEQRVSRRQPVKSLRSRVHFMCSMHKASLG